MIVSGTRSIASGSFAGHARPFSQDITFTSCFDSLPPASPLPQATIDHLQTSLNGRASALLGGLCAGRSFHDHLARGYVTVDVVGLCSPLNPSDPGYFGPTGIAVDTNGLFGDYTYIDGTLRIPVSDTLVAIEASSTVGEVTRPGRYTFYGRYVGWRATDHREPLPTNFGARYTAGRTSLVVWRDSKVVQPPFTCNTSPAWFPLGQEEVALFGEQEETSILAANQRPFPAEAGRVLVDSTALPTPFRSGWALLNLNTFVAAAGNNPSTDPNAAQAWVNVMATDSSGLFLNGYDAIRYDTACQAIHGGPGT